MLGFLFCSRLTTYIVQKVYNTTLIKVVFSYLHVNTLCAFNVARVLHNKNVISTAALVCYGILLDSVTAALVCHSILVDSVTRNLAFR